MKTIKDYTIYCTTEQTKKALELGAPIEEFNVSSIKGQKSYNYPTAEQMIGWLEEQEDIDLISICKSSFGDWDYFIFSKTAEIAVHARVYDSRKEATLAAIDAALEYLSSVY